MDTRAGQIPRCRVCLVQPLCNGHLELTGCGLILHSELEVCSVDTEKITNIQLADILLSNCWNLRFYFADSSCQQFTLQFVTSKQFFHNYVDPLQLHYWVKIFLAAIE